MKKAIAIILMWLVTGVFPNRRGFYHYSGLRCVLCPAGSYRVNHCAPNRMTECRLCQRNTFNPIPNKSKTCMSCSTCSGRFSRVGVTCTATRDTQCFCKEGYWYSQGICIPHRRCPPGLGVKRWGTSFSDVTCAPCTNETYSIAYSSFAPCQPFIDCNAMGLQIIGRGNRTHRRRCGFRNDVHTLPEQRRQTRSTPVSLSATYTTTLHRGGAVEECRIILEQEILSANKKYGTKVGLIVSAGAIVCIIAVAGIACFVKRSQRRKRNRTPRDAQCSAVGCQTGDYKPLLADYAATPGAIRTHEAHIEYDSSTSTWGSQVSDAIDRRYDDVTIVQSSHGVAISAMKRSSSVTGLPRPKPVLPDKYSNTISRCSTRNGEVRGIEKQQLVTKFALFGYLDHISSDSLYLHKQVSLSITTVPRFPALASFPSLTNSTKSDVVVGAHNSAFTMNNALANCDSSPKVSEGCALLVEKYNAKNEWRKIANDQRYQCKSTSPVVIKRPCTMTNWLDLTKKSQIRNCNVDVSGVHNCSQVALSNHVWPEGRSTKKHRPGVFYRYDERGGVLLVSPSATLTIPPSSAIPKGEVYAVKGCAVRNVGAFNNLLDVANGEHLVAPLIAYSICDNKSFHHPVKLNLEHCVSDDKALSKVKVYYCDSPDDPRSLTEVPPKAKDNNIRQDMYYVIEEDRSVSIYTTHFSVYVVTGQKEERIDVEARLCIKSARRSSQKDELRVRVYLCAALSCTRHYTEEFHSDQERLNYKMIDKKPVHLPDKVTPETEFNIQIQKPENWTCEAKDDGGNDFFPVNQVIEADMFVSNQAEPHCAAEWIVQAVVENAPYEGGIIIQPKVVVEDKKKKKSAKEASPPRVVKPTKFWLSLTPREPYQNGETSVMELVDVVDSRPLSEEQWEKAFDCVADNMLGKDVKPFAKTLGIEDAKLDGIYLRCRDDLREINRQICMDWKQRNPDDSMEQFLWHLQKKQLNMLVGRVRSTVSESVRA